MSIVIAEDVLVEVSLTAGGTCNTFDLVVGRLQKKILLLLSNVYSMNLFWFGNLISTTPGDVFSSFISK